MQKKLIIVINKLTETHHLGSISLQVYYLNEGMLNLLTICACVCKVQHIDSLD